MSRNKSEGVKTRKKKRGLVIFFLVPESVVLSLQLC